MTRRRGIVIGAVLFAVMAAILVLSNPSVDPYERPPLDPRGTGPSGTGAMVELARAEGAHVHLGGNPRDRDDVVVQLLDTWGGDAAKDLRTWVEAGGTLVTTDPQAKLAATKDALGVTVANGPGVCEVDALSTVERVEPGLPTPFAPSDTSSSCFTGTPNEGLGAGLDVRRVGSGLVVSVSSVEPFLNSALGRADNAVVVSALLVPHDGADVRVLDPLTFRSGKEVGDGTVLGALPPRGSEAVGQLVVAFLAWALIRGRRLGQPVVEELPVPLPASDLVLASGRLLDRNGDVSDAAERLRRRSRRDLGVATGLGPDPDPVDLANTLATRAGMDPELVRAALLAPVNDESALVATSAYLDRLRRDLHQ